ncbi:MAG: serine/threonine protein kinase, partial [Planctomycetota bacterium]
AIDAATGAEVARSLPLDLADAVINCTSDRIYTIMRDGRIECLRPVGAELPTLVEPVEFVPQEEPTAGETSTPTTQAPGRTTDPFGGAAAPAGDPFGTGAPTGDPFSTGGDAGMDDPFGAGGSDDPFGTDPFGSGN